MAGTQDSWWQGGYEEKPHEATIHHGCITMMENLPAIEYIVQARYVGHQIPTIFHKTYSGGSWRQTSLALSQRFKFGPEVEEAATKLMGYASGLATGATEIA